MKDHIYTLGLRRNSRSSIRRRANCARTFRKFSKRQGYAQRTSQAGDAPVGGRIGTEICQSIVHARAHVIELRSKLAELAGRGGLKIASVGTHPFSHWRDQLITEGERYREIVKDMQQLARANLIFGLHVHVGIPERETAIHVMNQARYFLPHIYALSVNSPFWSGKIPD